MRVAAVVLAAGSATRFGSGKLTEMLGDRPLVRHAIDAARAAGLDPIVVVAPPGHPFAGIDLGAVTVVTNSAAADGISGSVRLGLRALEADSTGAIDAAVILPADQPHVRADTITALVAAAGQRPHAPFVVARHTLDGTPSPVLARRSIWRLADELAGDRGFGPILATHPELVREIAIAGANPDVDTRADLDRLRATRSRPADVS